MISGNYTPSTAGPSGPPDGSLNYVAQGRWMGHGSPEGVVPGQIGDSYLDIDSGSEWGKIAGNRLKVGWHEEDDSDSSFIVTGGITARSNMDRWADRVDVKDFGARGLNTNDARDSDAFLAAIEVAKDRNTFIYMPDGIYRVNIPTDSRCGLVGASQRGVILRPYDSTKPVVLVDIGGFSGSSSNKERAEFKNFQINCLADNGVTPIAGTVGMRLGQHLSSYAGNSTNVYRNISIYGAGLDGLDIKDMTDCLFEHMNIEDSGRYGIYVENEASVQSSTFISVKARQNHSGIYLASGNHLQFFGCSFDSNRDRGIYHLRQSSSGPSSITYQNCWCENSGYNRTLVSSGSGESLIPATPDGQAAAIFLDGASSNQTIKDYNLLFLMCNISGAASDGHGGTVPYDIRADRGEALFDRCNFSLVSLGGFTSTKLRYSTGTAGTVHITLRQCATLNAAPTPAMYSSFPAPTILAGQSTSPSYGFFYDFEDVNGNRYSNKRAFGISGSPYGVLTPAYEGQVVFDNSGSGLPRRWTANGLTNTSWTQSLHMEQGSFTPIVAGQTTPGTATYSTQYGQYIKVGTSVTCWGRVAWSGHTGTGIMQMGGLPFTAANPQAAQACISGQSIDITGYVNISGLTSGGDDFFQIRKTNAVGTTVGLPIDASAQFDFDITYKASS